MKLDYVIEPISALEVGYLEYNNVGWLDLENEIEMDGTICHAYRGNNEVGRLALDVNGKILLVEVVPDLRRQLIATEMYWRLRDAGYKISHDTENLSEAGAAWLRSLIGKERRRLGDAATEAKEPAF